MGDLHCEETFDPILEIDNSITLDKITEVRTSILNLNNKIKHF